MNTLRLSRQAALSSCVAAATLTGCGTSQPPIGAPGAMLQAQQTHRLSSGNCPAYSGGTGILPDGDFSQESNPGNGFVEPSKGMAFAPDWEVAKRNIDFVGTGFWDMDGLCSVDLDGRVAGGIETSGFLTHKGTIYTVRFLLSGNGCEDSSGDHCSAKKSMKLEAATQFQTYTWNTANDNDAEHDIYARESWAFVAESQVTVLSFISEDVKSSGRGCVVAAIAVAKHK